MVQAAHYGEKQDLLQSITSVQDCETRSSLDVVPSIELKGEHATCTGLHVQKVEEKADSRPSLLLCHNHARMAARV
jgi:hypothetical protein